MLCRNSFSTCCNCCSIWRFLRRSALWPPRASVFGRRDGINFHITAGRAMDSVDGCLLTIPQLLSWIAAQGIHVPSASGSLEQLARQYGTVSRTS